MPCQLPNNQTTTEFTSDDAQDTALFAPARDPSSYRALPRIVVITSLWTSPYLETIEEAVFGNGIVGGNGAKTATGEETGTPTGGGTGGGRTTGVETATEGTD